MPVSINLFLIIKNSRALFISGAFCLLFSAPGFSADTEALEGAWQKHRELMKIRDEIGNQFEADNRRIERLRVLIEEAKNRLQDDFIEESKKHYTQEDLEQSAAAMAEQANATIQSNLQSKLPSNNPLQRFLHEYQSYTEGLEAARRFRGFADIYYSPTLYEQSETYLKLEDTIIKREEQLIDLENQKLFNQQVIDTIKNVTDESWDKVLKEAWNIIKTLEKEKARMDQVRTSEIENRLPEFKKELQAFRIAQEQRRKDTIRRRHIQSMRNRVRSQMQTGGNGFSFNMQFNGNGTVTYNFSGLQIPGGNNDAKGCFLMQACIQIGPNGEILND